MAIVNPIDTSLWTRENLAWVAGIFEGEGFCSLKANRSVVLGVHMCDEDVVRRFHSVVGVGQVSVRDRNDGIRKRQWCWEVTRAREAYALGAALFSFMGVRRQARLFELLVWFRAAPYRARRHGTTTEYVKHKCRCDLCVTAMRGYNKARRRNWKKGPNYGKPLRAGG